MKNKHIDETFTKEILDRVATNLQWSEVYKDFWVEGLGAQVTNQSSFISMRCVKGKCIKQRLLGME